MSKLSIHSLEFKPRTAKGAISGRRTIQVIAARHTIHPIQGSQWTRQQLDSPSELFTRGKKSKDKEERQAKGGGALPADREDAMELEWLTKYLNCSDARELRKLVDLDHPELSLSRRMVGYPARDGIPIRRDRVRNLMCRMR